MDKIVSSLIMSSESSVGPNQQAAERGGNQEYILKWNNYAATVTSTFKSILAGEDFVDVTLVAAKGQTLKAHRVVLAACSPYFSDILKGLNLWQHPVIVLKDVPFSDLQGIVEFIYHGEVSVDEDALDSLLESAKILKVRGLMAAEDSSSNDHQRTSPNSMTASSSITATPTKSHHSRKNAYPTQIKQNLSSQKRSLDHYLENQQQQEIAAAATSSSLDDSVPPAKKMPPIFNSLNHLLNFNQLTAAAAAAVNSSSVSTNNDNNHDENNAVDQEMEEEIDDDEEEEHEIDASQIPTGKDLPAFPPSGLDDPVSISQFMGGLSKNLAPNNLTQKKTCPYCYQQLSWHALSRHIRDMHRQQSNFVTCKYCLKMFRNKNSLGCHMWRFHKDMKDKDNSSAASAPSASAASASTPPNDSTTLPSSASGITAKEKNKA